LAQEWEAAYRPVALLLKSSPMDKVELSLRVLRPGYTERRQWS
jgi:hypothetical protein